MLGSALSSRPPQDKASRIHRTKLANHQVRNCFRRIRPYDLLHQLGVGRLRRRLSSHVFRSQPSKVLHQSSHFQSSRICMANNGALSEVLFTSTIEPLGVEGCRSTIWSKDLLCKFDYTPPNKSMESDVLPGICYIYASALA